MMYEAVLYVDAALWCARAMTRGGAAPFRLAGRAAADDGRCRMQRKEKLCAVARSAVVVCASPCLPPLTALQLSTVGTASARGAGSSRVSLRGLERILPRLDARSPRRLYRGADYGPRMDAASCLAAGDRAGRHPAQGRSMVSGFATGPRVSHMLIVRS